MSASSMLLAMAVVCACLAAVTAVLITSALDRRGLKTPFPFIGLFLFRNLIRYREITVGETGRIGSLFYLYVIPINAALVLVLCALAARSLGF